MNKSETISQLATALSAFQAEVKQPMKDANNPFFKSKYVPLENVVEAINEVANKHGLAFTQFPSTDESGRIGVATLLLHSSGEYIEYPAVYMKAEKENPQEAGKLISYLKRYSLSAIFGITSDVDDDANEATGNNKPKVETAVKKPYAKQTGQAVNTSQELDMAEMKKLYTAWNELDSGDNVLFEVWYEGMKEKFSNDMIKVTLRKKIELLKKEKANESVQSNG